MRPQKLDRDEETELRHILDRVSTRQRETVRLGALLRDWGDLVAKVERGYALTLDDYTNDLTVRDTIEEVLEAAGQKLRAKIAIPVGELDRRFMSATVEADKPLLPREHHWWTRVPVKRTGDFGVVILK